jgi:hypothetical protein
MHRIRPNRGLSRLLRKYPVSQRRDVRQEGFEIGMDECKDSCFEEANHVTEFQVSEINKVG